MSEYRSRGAELLRAVTKDQPAVWTPETGWTDTNQPTEKEKMIMAAITYLSRAEVAHHLGLADRSLKGYKLPEPDAVIGDRPGWLASTIDAWRAARPGQGFRSDLHTFTISSADVARCPINSLSPRHYPNADGSCLCPTPKEN